MQLVIDKKIIAVCKTVDQSTALIKHECLILQEMHRILMTWKFIL